MRQPDRQRRAAVRLVCALPLLVATGCSAPFLRPMSLAALPARAAIPTRGGEQLELEADGSLVVRPRYGDLERAFGARFAEDATEVRVAELVRGDCPLRPGDRIDAVEGGVVFGEPPSERARRTYLGAAEPGETSPAQATPWGGTPAVAPVRPVGRGHPVRGLDDLRGYTLAWCVLDLRVLREGKPTTVRIEVGAPRPVAARKQNPDRTRPAGYEAVWLESLPPELRPTEERGSLLVTWVAEGSPLARQGLRPFDQAVPAFWGSLLDADPARPAALEEWAQGPAFEAVWGPDGRAKDALWVPPQDPAEKSLPLLFAVVEGAGRSRIGVGPFDWIFHTHTIESYDRRTDRYLSRRDTSLLGLFSWSSAEGDGRHDLVSGSLGLGLDEARAHYWLELLNLSEDE